MTLEELRQYILGILDKSIGIRDEQRMMANTAKRVGGNLVDLIEVFKMIFEDYLNQAVKTTSDVEFASVLTTFIETINVVTDGMLAKKITTNEVKTPDFISGFDGKGWAVLLRDVVNVAGVKDKKSYAELDELTIRGGLRVLELIINQLKGEGDNSVFSGMMKVDHVDLENKKIFLDTGNGILYNPFRINDCLECERFGGRPSGDNDYNVQKHYELVIADTGMGADSDGESRLDWIVYNSFSGIEADIKKGDVLVRMDNLTDPDRKGIIMNTTVGAFAPYVSVLYGAKTDPDNAVKSRIGNLAGIYNLWFGWLKGFGAFIQNLYAIGEFHFKNGENIQTRLDMMENLFRVDMQNKTYNMSEKDNFLKNASFTENMDGWQRDNVIHAYTVAGKFLMFNRNLFAEKNRLAGIVNLEGRNVLRIKNSGIRQVNVDIRKPDPITSVLYLTFKYTCKSSGILTVGFVGSDQDEGHLPFVIEKIEENFQTEAREYSGTWDGTGDFVLQFTGDICIDVLAITNRPLDDFKIEVGTRFNQTGEKLSLLGDKINETDKTVANLGIELNSAAESIRLWGEKTDNINKTVTRIGLDLDIAEETLGLYVKKTDDINGSVTNIGLRVKAAEEELELFSRFEDKANGFFSDLGTRMDSAEGIIDTHAKLINSLDGSITSLGSRIDAVSGTLDTYVKKTDVLDGSFISLGSRMDAAEKKFTNYVLTETFTGGMSNVNTSLERQWSTIEQTNKNLLLALNKTTGYAINKDINFLKGLNGISLYNNSSGGAVTLVREGSNGTFFVKIQKVVGSSTPGLGGFTFSTKTRANAVFEARFTANIPVGYTLNFTTNAIGDNSRSQWISDRKGTGDWKEYRYQVFCGDSGSFSTTNFFYLTKDVTEGTNDDNNTTVTWSLKTATVFDLAGYEDPVTYINLTEDLAKIKAKRIEFEGTVTANENFKILEDGSIEAKDGKFSGTLEGVSGTFKSLELNNGSTEMKINSSGFSIYANGARFNMQSMGLKYTLSNLEFSFGNAGFGTNVTGDLLFILKGIPAKRDVEKIGMGHQNFIYEDNGYLKIANISR